jgi:hypothetical protein
VSHQLQRKSQAVSLTKTQSWPAREDSPWIEWKISLIVNIGGFYYPTGMAVPTFYTKPT